MFGRSVWPRALHTFLPHPSIPSVRPRRRRNNCSNQRSRDPIEATATAAAAATAAGGRMDGGRNDGQQNERRRWSWLEEEEERIWKSMPGDMPLIYWMDTTARDGHTAAIRLQRITAGGRHFFTRSASAAQLQKKHSWPRSCRYLVRTKETRNPPHPATHSWIKYRPGLIDLVQ